MPQSERTNEPAPYQENQNVHGPVVLNWNVSAKLVDSLLIFGSLCHRDCSTELKTSPNFQMSGRKVLRALAAAQGLDSLWRNVFSADSCGGSKCVPRTAILVTFEVSLSHWYDLERRIQFGRLEHHLQVCTINLQLLHQQQPLCCLEFTHRIKVWIQRQFGSLGMYLNIIYKCVQHTFSSFTSISLVAVWSLLIP